MLNIALLLVLLMEDHSIILNSAAFSPLKITALVLNVSKVHASLFVMAFAMLILPVQFLPELYCIVGHIDLADEHCTSRTDQLLTS